MEKPVIRITFVDSWLGFDPEHNFITDALRLHFTPQIVEEEPDFVFYSCFGLQHLRFPHAVKIFYTGENIEPDFNQCDFAITPSRISFGIRHLYLPVYASAYASDLKPELPPVTPEMAKRKFCSFVYSNDRVGEGSRCRAAFCRKLMDTYAHVDCPARVLHNVDAPELARRGDAANWSSTKISYLGKYKFNIAFENSSNNGYITEKLMDCYLGNTVPIYRGSEGELGGDIPRDSLICAHDYPTEEALIARIREVNENDELYLAMLAANPLRHGMSLDFRPIVGTFLKRAIERGTTPYDKDIWSFGDAARLSRLHGRVGGVRFLLHNLGLGLRSLVARGEKRRKLKEQRRISKYAVKDIRELQRLRFPD